ncbi:MAG TPA: hypothetical protein VGL56_11995 [Fimbriimonadaceae bacterium]|jgi:hypothetical protein
MKTRYKIAIGCAGLVTLGAALWPQLSFAQQTSGKADSLHKVVSKRFDNANASQVLAWLVEEGFNYVAKDNEFADARVSLNIEHKTVKQAADDLADALGGHWVRDNGVFVFHKGERTADGRDFEFSFNNDAMDQANAKDWQKQSQDWAKWGAEYAKQAQSQFGPDSQSMKELQEKMKGLADQMRNVQIDPGMMKDLTEKIEKLKKEKGFKDGEMTPKQKEEFEKEMKAWGEKFSKQFGDGKQWEQFGKGMEDWGKGFDKDHKNFNFKEFSPNMGDQKQWERYGKDMEVWGKAFAKEHPNGGVYDGKDMPPMFPMPAVPPLKGFDSPPMPPAVEGNAWPAEPPRRISGSNVKAALRSLTGTQKSLMESKGYLTPSDLTNEQRDLLNLPASGTWDLDFKIDGAELRIKDR